jgi:hypothetical protein
MRLSLGVAKGYFPERFGISKIMSNKTRLESDSMGSNFEYFFHVLDEIANMGVIDKQFIIVLL